MPRRVAPKLTPIGALEQWRRELGAGVRTLSTLDALWQAAAYEARAREEWRLGLRDAARDTMRTAAAKLTNTADSSAPRADAGVQETAA